MNYNKIALIGMMGCGKSAIAKILADEISYTLYEADEIFEKEQKILIKDYFKQFGEQNFRKLETEILKKISKTDKFVLSCGGGVILSSENRKILFRGDIYTIYLSANADTIYERIKNDSVRPLLFVENPKKKIEEILLKRNEYYNLANLKINTDNKTMEEVKSEILKAIWKK